MLLARDTSQLKGEQRREIENPCKLNGGNDQVIKTVKTRQSTDNDEKFTRCVSEGESTLYFCYKCYAQGCFELHFLFFLSIIFSILLLLLSLIIILILLSSSTSSLVNYT